MLILLIAGLTLAARTDTVRVADGTAFLVSREAIRTVRNDSVLARLPWSAPEGLSPIAACPGPDHGLIVLDASRGGRIVHLAPSLRIVSSHPLPSSIHASELAGASASWDRSRGLVLVTSRPPRRRLLGFLAGPVVDLPLTDSVPVP